MSTRQLSKALKVVRDARRACKAARDIRWKLENELNNAKRAEEAAEMKRSEAQRALDTAIVRATDPAPQKSS